MNITDQTIINYFGKNPNIKVLGSILEPFFYKLGEISIKDYQQLKTKEKEEHINKLLDLDYSDWTSTDEYILQIYGPVSIEEIQEYRSLYHSQHKLEIILEKK